MQNPTPPDVAKKPHEMTNHGHTRVDDYYWMRLSDDQKSAEQKDTHTKEVVNYIEAENDYTENRLKHTRKFQDDLFNEIVGRIKKDDESVPYLDNGYFYYTRYEKGKEYAIHCRKKGSLDSVEEILLDENVLSKGHDYFAVGGMDISPDNQWMSYGVDLVSRRIYTIYFKNLRTGDILEQTIPNATGNVAWANDNKTVFYTSKNEVTLLSEKIWRHKVGTDSAKDDLVYEEKDDSFYNGVYRSKSGEFIIIYNSSTLVNDYHILSTNNPGGNFKNFSPRGTEHEYGIDHYEDKFYIISNWKAKNNCLMETSDNATDMSNWKEVLPHRDQVHLLGMEIFKDHLVLNERKDGLRGLRVINQKSGKDEYINFGEQTYTVSISVNEEFNTNVLRYSYTSMVSPSSTYDYNMDSGEKSLMKQQEVVGGYDQELYKSERRYALARDGQPIPISMVYKKDLKNKVTFNSQGSNNPQNVLLYAYGSYGATMDPYFSSTRLSLLDRGFIFAIAHVRGSQIYGRKSYDDGKILNKKNTFTDFIDVGKYLIKDGLADSDHLFAEGGSAGGLLIGAVVNMAPELWKGAIAAVPFVDVVTTMLDASIPLTSNEWDEWGNPVEKKYYDYMLSYSPYDQVKNQAYPNILVTSGFFDSQVQYWEPLKWIAKLRDHWQGDNDLYLHMNMDAGHGGKSGRFRRYREVALEYAFLFDLAEVEE
jgi:oligopeptidase B